MSTSQIPSSKITKSRPLILLTPSVATTITRTKQLLSSNNTTSNKNTYKQKNRPNFQSILINCQSIKRKAADIEALNNLHNPDIISGYIPQLKTETFSQNTLMFLEKTRNKCYWMGYSKYPKLISSQLI